MNSSAGPSRKALAAKSAPGLILAAALLVCAHPAQSEAESASRRQEVKVWREDLALFDKELPARHANAFHHISPTAFKAEVAELDRRLATMNGDQFWVGLQRIESSIGDGHTFMRLPKDAPRFALQFKRFEDDYRLIAAAPDAVSRQMLGARLRGIDGVSVDEVHRRLLPLTPQDETQPLRELRAEPMLSNGLVLHGLGIIGNRAAATYTLEGYDGRRFVVRVVAPDPTAQADWIAVAPAHQTAVVADQAITCEKPRAPATLYCQFQSYDGLQPAAQAMLSTVRADGIKRLILDLRKNGGGNFCEGLKYVVEPIAQISAINRLGGLYILIGPQTFSAAMSNTAHFRQRTQAILVGRPIGEKPDSYQEIDDLTLPGTGWTARYSTKFYRFSRGAENLIRPDIEIDPTWADYQHGADPALAYVLALPLDLANPPPWRSPVPAAEEKACPGL